MFFLLFEKSNKKDVTISSSITNITSTFGFVIIVFIIDWAFICSKLLNSLINIKCRLTEKYAVTPILNIKAITNKMLETKKMISNIKDAWDYMTIQERQNLVHQCIEKIVINDNNVDIHYKLLN